ncbi:MAG TPA: adenylate/guanylate cyclase domain-containing protein, partial [Dongiaceae bacterium]|nr:adenylate/guanylate cyclase domain-containing protein [Dongiaceae bacterium]
VWLLGLLIYVLARNLTPVLSALLTVSLVAIISTVVLWQFTTYFLWLPWFNGVLVLTPVAGGLGMWLRSRELQLQKTRLQQAFGKYLPAEEIRRLVEQRELPANQAHHNSVCLVTDAQGYSRLSEQLPPAELAALMQDYYSAVIGAIRAGKGLISDVAGDGIIALWPHLEPAEAWTTLAPVITAIQQAVREFNQRHPQHSLPTRIGLHAGEIVLGHFGAVDHYEFRAMGDIVNTTARLEGVNKQIGTQVLLSEDCVLGPDEKIRNLGRYRFVGKSNPLRLYTTVSTESPDLLIRFGRALAEFEQGNRAAATQQFRSLATEYPEDAPSQFLAELLEKPSRRQDESQQSLDVGVIPLSQK